MTASTLKLADFRGNLLTLSFSGELESAFWEEYFQNSLRQVRMASLLGIFFYGFFGVLDAWLVPEAKGNLWFIRYAIVCPYIFAVFLFSFTNYFKKYMQLSIVSVVIVAGLGIIAMILIAPDPASYSYYAGLILVFIYGYTFFRLRFIWATLAGWTIVLGYEFAAVWLSQLIENCFFEP